MCQTLFIIPRQLAGIDVFGFGWLLGIWALASLLLIGRSWRRGGWNQQTRGNVWMCGVVAAFIAFFVPLVMHEEGLLIRGYGALVLLAIVVGFGMSVHRARRFGVDPEVLYSLATWLFVAGFVGARLFYVLEYFPDFHKPTLGQTIGAVLNYTEGGLVVYGGLLAGGAALAAFVYKHNLPGLALTDLIAPGVVLAVGIGRLGCFMNGCCYGGVSDVPWAVQFPATSPVYVDQARQGQLLLHGMSIDDAVARDRGAVIREVAAESQAARQGLKPGDRIVEINGRVIENADEARLALLSIYGQGAPLAIRIAGEAQPKRWEIDEPPPRSLPVHPAQLYSFIDAALLCLLLLAFEPYKTRDGELTALVLVIHPISRFLLETIRVDEGAVMQTGMSISQNISLAILAGGVFLWIYLWTRRPSGCAWHEPAAVG